MSTSPAIVVPVTPQTIDAASATFRIVKDRWPDSFVVGLRSVDAPDFSDADECLSVDDYCDPYESRCLTSNDQIALSQPPALRHILSKTDAVVWCGSGVLPVGPMPSLPDTPVTIAALSTVRPQYSLTPALTLPGFERSPGAEPRLVVLRSGADSFLDEWSEVCRQAVIDVDQRPVSEHSDRFVVHAAATNAARLNGSDLLMSWIDFAAVQSNRAEGQATPFVLAHELFQMERELQQQDQRPEVEWEMLVHRVHDSRPIEFLRDAIVASPHVVDMVDGRRERFIADARRAADPFGHVWRGDGSDAAFESWLLETNQFGMTRAAELTVRATELWWQFPKARYEPAAFYEYLHTEGVQDLGFDPRTLTAIPARSGDVLEESPSSPIAWRWNVVKQLMPGSQSRNEDKKYERIVGVDPGVARGVAAPKRVDIERVASMWGGEPRSLSLIGCIRSESGLGQAARASLQALQLLDRPFSYIDTSEKYPSRNSVETGLDWSTFGNSGDVNLIHSNSDEMITMAGGAFSHRFGGRFNAAMWFWETADLPRRSRPAFDIVDELWVASEYMVDVLGQYAQVPVHNIGLASDLPEYRDVDRADHGFRDDELVFLFVYDALSSYGRKNPRKALDAFINAFGPRFDGVRFVLKVSNLNKFPSSQAEILALQEKYPAITVIDEYLTRDGVLDLMSAADIYISLHAAEGYGLTLLEAMALGTPTVCTAYSGNMDFTTDANSWLVDYEMIATDEQTGPYPSGSIWASPNVDSATDLLRHAANNPAEVKTKAVRARRDALDAASLERYAERLDAQLRRIGV